MINLRFLFLFLTASLMTFAQTREVGYRVMSGKKGFTITYTNKDGGTSQQKVTGDLWNKRFDAKEGMHMYISAQTLNTDTYILVQIIENDIVIKASSSEGDYVIASNSVILQKKGDGLIMKPYEKDFKSKTILVYPNSPLTLEPNMSSEKVTTCEGEVELLERINEKYYKARYKDFEGFIWIGWFKK